jgi:hypothetical protein
VRTAQGAQCARSGRELEYPSGFTVGLACANKLRKLLAAERIELAEGGAFALIALERVVAFPAICDTRFGICARLAGLHVAAALDRPD